jgi:hypothetical protein
MCHLSTKRARDNDENRPLGSFVSSPNYIVSFIFLNLYICFTKVYLQIDLRHYYYHQQQRWR